MCQLACKRLIVQEKDWKIEGEKKFFIEKPLLINAKQMLFSFLVP